MLDPHALTIGFARRFTGYKRPDLVFRDADRLARLVNARRPARAVRLRRQGASGRRSRQASPAERLPARARSAVRRPHRVRRRLRPARRAPARAGLRRLAQHAAQAARSQRHERHEGVDERRAAPEHRRRLVGRRLHGHERLADRRRARRRRTPTRWTPRTPSALHAARRRGRAGVLRARRARRPAPLDRDGQAGDPHHHAAVLRAADAQGVRRARVRAGDRDPRQVRPGATDRL